MQGRIPIVKNGIFLDKNNVFNEVKKTLAIRTENMVARSWLMDTLQCVNKIKSDDFTLDMIYSYEEKSLR